jgi:hypothetical protein
MWNFNLSTAKIIVMDTLNEKNDFLIECHEARQDFARTVRQYDVSDNLNLRTCADTLLIMFDQLCDKYREGKS